MYDELTEVDIQKMKDEIDYRTRELRPKLIEEVKVARGFGDLSENFEYKAAKREKNRNDSRIRYLQRMVDTAKVISDHSSGDVVGLFDKVVIYIPDDDEEQTIRLVTTLRQNALEGLISKESPVGRAVMGADVFISLTHFKGHEEAGFGGTLKNIGMGCGSRAGKMEQHNAGKPHVAQEHCVGCGACTRICAHSGLTVTDRKASIDHSRCVGCGRCIAVCPWDAIRVNWDETVTNLNRKIAEYAQAVVDGRPCFHISLVIDVSPNCDCHPENDAAIIPNVGMFASFDPVALDMACADAVNAQPPLPGAAAAGDCGHDHFHHLHPETDWMSCLEHAEKLGMGTREYELIKI